MRASQRGVTTSGPLPKHKENIRAIGQLNGVGCTENIHRSVPDPFALVGTREKLATRCANRFDADFHAVGEVEYAGT